jgi:outer membrane biosynthesis protein TonB
MIIKKLHIAIISLMILSALVFGCATDQSEKKSKNSICQNMEDTSPIDKYRIEVAYQVNQNWEYPNDSKCIRNIQTSIVNSIFPNGEIEDIFFHKKSDCKDLDDSAYSAIESAAPFKPFPKDLDAEIVELGLMFSPDGVK